MSGVKIELEVQSIGSTTELQEKWSFRYYIRGCWDRGVDVDYDLYNIGLSSSQQWSWSYLEGSRAEEVAEGGAKHPARHDEGQRHRGVTLGDIVVNVGDAEGVEEGAPDAGNEEAEEDERHAAPVPDHLDLADVGVPVLGLLRHPAHVLRWHCVSLPASLILGLVTNLGGNDQHWETFIFNQIPYQIRHRTEKNAKSGHY